MNKQSFSSNKNLSFAQNLDSRGARIKKVLLFNTKYQALLILFFISLMVFFAWMKLNQQAPPPSQAQKKQALEQMLGRSVKEARVIPQGENIYTGTLFSLSYPAYAKADGKNNTNITNNTNVLEYLRFSSEEPHFRFVVMVGRADGAVLTELSGVKVRGQSKLYQKLPITVDSKQGALFVKASEGVERSSFFLKDGRSYSFSITGADASELERVYGKIMESVRF